MYAAFVFDPTPLVASTDDDDDDEEMKMMMMLTEGRCRSWYCWLFNRWSASLLLAVRFRTIRTRFWSIISRALRPIDACFTSSVFLV
jgi:hypothetical protein